MKAKNKKSQAYNPHFDIQMALLENNIRYHKEKLEEEEELHDMAMREYGFWDLDENGEAFWNG